MLALYSRLQEQVLVGQNERRWGADGEFGSGAMFVHELRGKTVGVLGYGHVSLRPFPALARRRRALTDRDRSDGKRPAWLWRSAHG